MGLGPISSGNLATQNINAFYSAAPDDGDDVNDAFNAPGRNPAEELSPSEWSKAAADESDELRNSREPGNGVGKFWSNFSALPAGVATAVHELPVIPPPSVEFVATNNTAMQVVSRASDAFSAIGDFADKHPAAAAVGTIAVIAGVGALAVAAGVISAPVAIGVGIFSAAATLFA